MPIEVQIFGIEGLRKAAEKFASAGGTMRDGLLSIMRKYSLASAATSKKEFFTGRTTRGKRQGKNSGSLLRVITGRLRSSITGFAKQSSSSRYEASIGTNVEYARVHEFGYDGTLNIPAHTRVVTKVFGKAVNPTTSRVRPHTRNVSIGPRPFLRPAMEKNIGGLEQGILDLLGKVTSL